MAQSRFGSFAFALSFLEVNSQNLLVSKANEWLQSLSQFGFSNSSFLLVSQIGLISALINLKVLKFKLTNCLSGIRNAWHFQHAVGFVIKLVCGNVSSALLTP